MASAPATIVTTIAEGRALADGTLGLLLARLVGEHFALVYPDFTADTAVGREGFNVCVIDVGAKRVQRHLTIVILFASCDFSTTETPRNHDLHALGAGLHGAHDRLLHGAAERDTLFELVDDILADETRVEFGMLDLDDVDLNVFLGQVLEVLANIFDADAALSDNDTGLRSVNDHARLIGTTLDLHFGDRCSAGQATEIFANGLVFMEPRFVVLFFEPAAFPCARDAETQADRVNLLSHKVTPTLRPRVAWLLACASRARWPQPNGDGFPRSKVRSRRPTFSWVR